VVLLLVPIATYCGPHPVLFQMLKFNCTTTVLLNAPLLVQHQTTTLINGQCPPPTYPLDRVIPFESETGQILQILPIQPRFQWMLSLVILLSVHPMWMSGSRVNLLPSLGQVLDLPRLLVVMYVLIWGKVAVSLDILPKTRRTMVPIPSQEVLLTI